MFMQHSDSDAQSVKHRQRYLHMPLDPGQAHVHVSLLIYKCRQKKKVWKDRKFYTCTHSHCDRMTDRKFPVCFQIPILIGRGIKQTHLHEETSRWTSRQDMTRLSLSVCRTLCCRWLYISVCLLVCTRNISQRAHTCWSYPVCLLSRQLKRPHQSGWKINDTTVQDLSARINTHEQKNGLYVHGHWLSPESEVNFGKCMRVGCNLSNNLSCGQITCCTRYMAVESVLYEMSTVFSCSPDDNEGFPFHLTYWRNICFGFYSPCLLLLIHLPVRLFD